MKGLQVWADALCRSEMSLYEWLAKSFDVPLRILCENPGTERFKLGWDPNEYAHLDIVQSGRTFSERVVQLEEHGDWAQWFDSYQNHELNRRLMVYAKKKRCLVGVGSEAPTNGIRPSIRRAIKESSLFWRLVARRCREAIDAASFVVNYSGDETSGLLRNGWSADKIIPFGYYPPPMTGSTYRRRELKDWQEFSILVTGVMDWRRGQDDVITAISVLKRMGYSPHVIMTQKGELYSGIEKRVREEHLNVELVGFAEYEDLLRYHSECSVYVASGRREPWGMRINDALNAGSPLVVSRGMGGIKLVNDYGCGRSYYAGDALDLAWQLKSLMDSSESYLSTVEGVSRAVTECSPKAKAQWLAKIIRERFPEWR